ncbi:MAG TPA: patatin-like phospholipase family protein [Thiobacillus sp.]|nr:patatin-like phospholipase family protein [Thiobacillus sp.]
MDTNTNTVCDEFSRVLRDEIEQLRPQAHDPQQSSEACADRAQLVGLALSGGGIRSATFCLGVIQALARLRLLRAFDYLSTVSGGGYIGAWLSTLIFRSHKPGQSEAEALATVELELSGEARPWCKAGTPASDCPPEHPSLRFLRRYSNYLTPRLGVFSGDSLAAVSTYLRNLLLNQLILVAFFGALLTLPYLLLNVSLWLADKKGLALTTPLWHTGLPLMVGLAIGPLLVAVGACAMSLMRFHKGDLLDSTRPRFIVGLIVVPSLISAWLFALTLQAEAAIAAAAPLAAPAAKYSLWDWVMWTTLVYLAPWLVVFWLKSGGSNVAMGALEKLAALWAARGNPERLRAALDELIEWGSGLVRFAWQLPWTLLAGALGGVIFYSLRKGADNLPEVGAVAYATAFGTPLVLLSYSAVVTLHIGMMKRLYTDHDREWWARLGGFIVLAAVIWLAVFAVTLYAAPLVKWLAGLAVAGGLAWAATSIGGVLLGKSSFTGGQGQSGKGKAWLDRVVVVAPYVFIIGLAIVLASVLHAVLTSPGWLCDKCLPITAAVPFGLIVHSSMFNLAGVEMTAVLGVGGICAAVFVLLSWRVDINLFSLHGFYRNRLTRCYLGATRVGQTVPIKVVRKPHPFTGFDPGDDLPLSVLAKQRPFPIVNAAMNLNGGENLAWQTRRAASFVFTPCYTGFEFWDSEGDRIGAYRRTEEYAASQFAFLNPPGGIELGTVVATSGAATNPNMGYHTSAALSALMSVFNVRLGRWCGNPRHPTAWRKASPRFGGLALLREVFGMLNSRASFLNVSDGGHFENLGIYELVRRRCHIVVAVDAGCDPDYQFEDLANAVRKCWTDFGTRIEIDLAALRPQGETKRSESYFAVGCIRYLNAPQPGVLIYIKATLTGNESSDVKEYADRHSKFPNESTGDQFFDENQFESYRELGRHIGLKVFAPLFSPLINTSALRMTPEQIRDALPDRLPDHPALQARQKNGRGDKPAPTNEAPTVDSWMEVTMMAITPARGEGES